MKVSNYEILMLSYFFSLVLALLYLSDYGTVFGYMATAHQTTQDKMQVVCILNLCKPNHVRKLRNIASLKISAFQYLHCGVTVGRTGISKGFEPKS